MKKRLLSLFIVFATIFMTVSVVEVAAYNEFSGGNEDYQESEWQQGGSQYLSVNGHELICADNKLYDNGTLIADEVYDSFFSNGEYLFYNKQYSSSGISCIIRVDLSNHNEIIVTQGELNGNEYHGVCLEGVYKNKYLYYDKPYNYGYIDSSGRPYAELFDSPLGIFDLETGKEIKELSNSQVWVIGDYIYTIPMHGDASPQPLWRYKPDGSSPIKITDEIYDYGNPPFKIYGTKLIYSAYNVDLGWNNIRYQIREYDLKKGTTTNLTEYYRNTYPVEIYNDYAVFENYANGKRTTVYYERPSFTVIYNEGEHNYLKMDGSILDYIDECDSTTYSPKLSLTLLCLSFAAYNDKSNGHQPVNTQAEKEKTNIYKSFASLGFDDIKLNEYYDDPNDKRYGEDNCAFTIGHQKMPDGRNLIAVAIRGSYGELMKNGLISLVSDDKDSDWRSDFNFVANNNNNHTGIDTAAKKVKKGIEKYVDTYKLDNNVYVITGHSRGGGVGNLITKYMVDEGVPIENIYNYNFASLNTTINLKARYNYPNIFNICNQKDPIVSLPPSDFSWGKYGRTLWFSKNSLDVQTATLFWGSVNAPTEILIDPGAHLLQPYLAKVVSLPEINEYEQEGTIRIICDNNLLTFDQPAMIVNDRTLVPLRGIFEALGASVNWNGLTQTATALKDNTNISIQIGGKQLYVNGVSVELDVPAQIANDRTLVPVRAVSESFGCKVDWDGNTQTVYINSK